jgi:rhodanese-related sulfurtransferase
VAVNQQRVPEVGPEEAQRMIESGAFLLDVREEDEWQAGRAPSATHVALGTLPQRLDEVPNDRQVVAICRVGGRSARATAFLMQDGRDVVNLTGGMKAWAAAGLPVVDDAGGAGRVI